jgi:hypothetical protein
MTHPGPPEGPADGDATAAPDRAGRTARPLLVLSWLLATVLAGVVAWSAVTVVAGAPGEDGAGVVSQADVEARLAEAGATDSPRAADPTPAGTSTPGATSPPGTAGSPGGVPVPTGSAAPPAENPSGAAPGPAPTPAAPAAQEVARTWDVTGGQVAAACAGADIRLLYATPADGWTVEVEGAGPQEVEVQLTRDGSRTRVRAECLAGTPELTRNGADDGGGGEDDDGDDG